MRGRIRHAGDRGGPAGSTPLWLLLCCWLGWMVAACSARETAQSTTDEIAPVQEAPVSVAGVIAIASRAVRSAEEAGWTQALTDVRTRIDALTATSAVLLRALAIAEGNDEPVELARFFAPVIRSGEGDVRIVHPDGAVGRSVGSPSRGWLRDGVAMPDGPHWIVNRPRERYGTSLAVQELYAGLTAVAEAYPGTPPVGIFDLSFELGGASPPHVSHESGRGRGFLLLFEPPGQLGAPFLRRRTRTTWT